MRFQGQEATVMQVSPKLRRSAHALNHFIEHDADRHPLAVVVAILTLVLAVQVAWSG